MQRRVPSESKVQMSENTHPEILVVDDDGMSRRVLAQLLNAAGYNCRVSKDGSEALGMIHERPPSLLLLDFDMPGPNGAEVLRRLRSDNDPAVAQIPAIMLTAHGSEQSEVSCLQAGADDFVTKPVNASVLRARIETQLRLRSQVATCYRPVIQVGGDIYGWLRMKDGRILFWIADGTGHGAAAALLTTLAKLLFHYGSIEHDTPTSLMEAVNHDFRSIFGARSFMTAMCVALDPGTGHAAMVGAGHPPLLIFRHDGTTQSIGSVAPPLGLKQCKFTETPVDLKPGDAFLLYTDGILCGKNERRGRAPDQLEKILRPFASSAEALLKQVLAQTAPENPPNPAPDDVAAIVVRREGRQ